MFYHGLMHVTELHPWNVSIPEAVRLQNELREKIVLRNQFGEIKAIAGCDMALDAELGTAIGGVIVYSFPDLCEIERKWAAAPLVFPYVPGLLSFREAPALLEVFQRLEHEPDLVIFDGQGIAHPRRLGIAAHMGLYLDKPAIGCAKSRLYGRYREPPLRAGSSSDLLDEKGERLGTVLRTRDGVKPVFVSPGYGVDFETSVRIIRQCMDGYRIPKPTREADRFVAKIKKEYLPPVMVKRKACIMCGCMLEEREMERAICVRCKPFRPEETDSAAKPGNTPAPAKPERRKKILVIDDEPVLVKLLKNRLEANGYEVFTAGDGEEGYERIKTLRPDLVLSDILMPRLTGYDLLKRLQKETDGTQQIPVLIMTAKGGMKEFFDAWEIHGFIMKPISPDELLEKIRCLLETAEKVRGKK